MNLEEDQGFLVQFLWFLALKVLICYKEKTFSDIIAEDKQAQLLFDSVMGHCLHSLFAKDDKDVKAVTHSVKASFAVGKDPKKSTSSSNADISNTLNVNAQDCSASVMLKPNYDKCSASGASSNNDNKCSAAEDDSTNKAKSAHITNQR